MLIAMADIFTGNEAINIWTGVIVVVALLAIACWMYAMRISSLRAEVFSRSGKFSWFATSLDADAPVQRREEMLTELVSSLGVETLSIGVDEPARLADKFTELLHDRPWMHQLHGKESLLARIRRAFPNEDENRKYFPAIEQRILAITSMVKESNASQYMPHLADLSQMTRERDDSRVTVQVFNCVCSVVLLMGIFGTLYGIGDKLEATGIPSLTVLRSSLLPSAVSVALAAVLRVLREIYQASAESFYTKLDRFTMMVLVPIFQPLTDLKGESDRFRRLIRILGVFNHERINGFFAEFHGLCRSLLTSEEKIRRIEEIIVTRLQRTREAQQRLMQQMAAFLGSLQQYAGLLEKSMVLCQGVLVHYKFRPELPTAAAARLDSAMSRLQGTQELLCPPDMLEQCLAGWQQGVAAYETLQNSIERLNLLVAELNMAPLRNAYAEVLQEMGETLPGICETWSRHMVKPIGQQSCAWWGGVSDAFASYQEVHGAAVMMRAPIDDLAGMTGQLSDSLRQNNVEATHGLSSLGKRIAELENHLNRIYLSRCWECLTSRRMKEAWSFLRKWLELGGEERKQRLADRTAIIIQFIILYLF